MLFGSICHPCCLFNFLPFNTERYDVGVCMCLSLISQLNFPRLLLSISFICLKVLVIVCLLRSLFTLLHHSDYPKLLTAGCWWFLSETFNRSCSVAYVRKHYWYQESRSITSSLSPYVSHSFFLHVNICKQL